MYIEPERLGLNGVDYTVELSIRKEIDQHIFFVDNPQNSFPVQNVCAHVCMLYIPPLLVYTEILSVLYLMPTCYVLNYGISVWTVQQ